MLVDRLTPGEVRIEPGGPLADGQTVGVLVSGFPPGTTATAVLCAPPEGYDARRCGAPEPSSTFAVDPAGAGRTTLKVAAGRLGSDTALCGPRRLCGIAVVVNGGFVAAPVTPVRFSAGPGVDYDGARVLFGVLTAMAPSPPATSSQGAPTGPNRPRRPPRTSTARTFAPSRASMTSSARTSTWTSGIRLSGDDGHRAGPRRARADPLR